LQRGCSNYFGKLWNFVNFAVQLVVVSGVWFCWVVCFLSCLGVLTVIEATTELVGCTVSAVRKRLNGGQLSDDQRADIAVAVCQRCWNESATPQLVVWRAAGDFLAAEAERVLRRESAEEVLACHAEYLAADRARVASLPKGSRYVVSGRYGSKSQNFLPALPYETAGRNRWHNLNVERAAGVVELDADELRDRCDDLADFFASREVNAVEC
jgi:hypothetical protein